MQQNNYNKEEFKKMLAITINNRIDYAIEFICIIEKHVTSKERLILSDILTALSLNDVEFAKELIKNI